MKVRSITYSMLRVTGPYENDRVEVTVELGARDTVDAATLYAREECARALGVPLTGGSRRVSR